MRFTITSLIVTAVLLVSGTFAAPTSDVSAVEFDKRTPQSFGRGGYSRDSYQRSCRRRWSRNSDRNRCYRGWDDCNRRYRRDNDRYGCYRGYGGFSKRAVDSDVQQTTAQQAGEQQDQVQQTVAQQSDAEQAQAQPGPVHILPWPLSAMQQPAAQPVPASQPAAQHAEQQANVQPAQQPMEQPATVQPAQQAMQQANVQPAQQPATVLPAQPAVETPARMGVDLQRQPSGDNIQASFQFAGTPEQAALQRFQDEHRVASEQQIAVLSAMQNQIDANLLGAVNSGSQ